MKSLIRHPWLKLNHQYNKMYMPAICFQYSCKIYGWVDKSFASGPRANRLCYGRWLAVENLDHSVYACHVWPDDIQETTGHTYQQTMTMFFG